MKPKPVRLAEILLCLEEKMRNEDAIIGGPCQSEMKAHRHMLMEDYAVSPELVAKCGSDITKSCQKEVQKGHGPGETIHCLLRLAAEHKLEEPSCEDELKVLLKEVDVASDWQVDPVLQKTCQDVVTAACDPASSATGIMSCLMTQVATHSRHMTQECKATLMEIQYFLARDYALDPKLYQ
jgi:Golgi apparatus protein 1